MIMIVKRLILCVWRTFGLYYIYRVIFPTWRMNKTAAESCNSIAKNVHFSGIDWHYYIISGHKLRKYFNVLPREQDKFMLRIKQYRLLKFSTL